MGTPQAALINTTPPADPSSSGASGPPSTNTAATGGDAAASQAIWMAQQTDRAITSTQVAFAASAVVGQLEESFPGLVSHRFAKAAARAAPLLALRPAQKESGFGGFVGDTKTWSIAAILAIVGAQEAMKKVRDICDIRITRCEAELERGTMVKIHVDAFDDHGGHRPAGQEVTYASNNPQIAAIDADGVVTAKEEGIVNLTASLEDYSDMVMVKVVPSQHHGSQEHTTARAKPQSTA